MDRVVIVGRGGAGKSTAASRLSRITGVPVIELDQHFWSADLVPLGRPEWARVQEDLAAAPRWIMDGDLGPYDVLPPRLRRADTVLVMDFPLLLCAWRAAGRGRERLDFWSWMLMWRLRYRKPLLRTLALHAAHAQIHVLKSSLQLEEFLVASGERHQPL